MKTLHKLADWIAGGEITKLTDELADERQARRNAARGYREVISQTGEQNRILRDGLNDIINAQTPACAGIGRKMAGIASTTLARADGATEDKPVKVAA